MFARDRVCVSVGQQPLPRCIYEPSPENACIGSSRSARGRKKERDPGRCTGSPVLARTRRWANEGARKTRKRGEKEEGKGEGPRGLTRRDQRRDCLSRVSSRRRHEGESKRGTHGLCTTERTERAKGLRQRAERDKT